MWTVMFRWRETARARGSRKRGTRPGGDGRNILIRDNESLGAAMLVEIIIGVAAAGAVWLASSVRVVKQFERGLIFRFGQVHSRVREPGLVLLVPIADR